jgi:hypothetical protein
MRLVVDMICCTEYLYASLLYVNGECNNVQPLPEHSTRLCIRCLASWASSAVWGKRRSNGREVSIWGNIFRPDSSDGPGGFTPGSYLTSFESCKLTVHGIVSWTTTCPDQPSTETYAGSDNMVLTGTTRVPNDEGPGTYSRRQASIGLLGSVLEIWMPRSGHQ